MANIGKRIKARREELGMTQAELAKRLGYKSKTTIAKIESGVNDIVQSKVVSFAEALNTTPAYLMGWEEKESLGSILSKNLKMYLRNQMRISMIRRLRRKYTKEQIRKLYENAGLYYQISKKGKARILYSTTESRA